MEKASQNQVMKDAVGEPIVKGPWYNASLAVAHKRQTVSCTFPVSGPRGNGVLQLKAIRNGADNWASFFLPHDWEILIMEALLHVPENDERHQAMRIRFLDNIQPDACMSCQLQESEKPEKTQWVTYTSPFVSLNQLVHELHVQCEGWHILSF